MLKRLLTLPCCTQLGFQSTRGSFNGTAACREMKMHVTRPRRVPNTTVSRQIMQLFGIESPAALSEGSTICDPTATGRRRERVVANYRKSIVFDKLRCRTIWMDISTRTAYWAQASVARPTETCMRPAQLRVEEGFKQFSSCTHIHAWPHTHTNQALFCIHRVNRMNSHNDSE